MPPMMHLINELGTTSWKTASPVNRGGRKAHVVAMFGEFDLGVRPSAAPPGTKRRSPRGGLVGGQPAACYFPRPLKSKCRPLQTVVAARMSD